MRAALWSCSGRCGELDYFISRWNAPIGDRWVPWAWTAPLLGRLGLSLSDYQSLDAAAQIEKAGEVIRVLGGRTAADTPAKLYLSILYPDTVFWPPHQRWARMPSRLVPSPPGRSGASLEPLRGRGSRRRAGTPEAICPRRDRWGWRRLLRKRGNLFGKLFELDDGSVRRGT